MNINLLNKGVQLELAHKDILSIKGSTGVAKTTVMLYTVMQLAEKGLKVLVIQDEVQTDAIKERIVKLYENSKFWTKQLWEFTQNIHLQADRDLETELILGRAKALKEDSNKVVVMVDNLITKNPFEYEDLLEKLYNVSDYLIFVEQLRKGATPNPVSFRDISKNNNVEENHILFLEYINGEDVFTATLIDKETAGGGVIVTSTSFDYNPAELLG